MHRLTVTMRAAVLVGIVLAAGCGESERLPEVSEVVDHEPDQHFIGSRIVVTEGGITNAVVTADTVDVFADEDHTLISGAIAIDFYDHNGERTSTLTADRGEVWGLYDQVDSLSAAGNVRIVSVDGGKWMETSASLIWRAGTRRITAEGLVRLVTENGFEEGINFEAADDLSEYRMDQVSGEYEGTGTPFRE